MSAHHQTASAVRVLVVEDELVVAMDMQMQLTRFGYEVAGIAATSEEALNMTETEHPDLVLMDIRVRGSRDGIDTAAEIRRKSNVRVVFISASANPDIQQRAHKVSPYGFLAKPYRPEELLSIVSGALHQHER